MGPKRSKAVVPLTSKKAGADRMAKALGTTVRLKLTPNQLTTYVGRELGVPGAFWGITSGKNDSVMDDQNVIYPMKVLKVDNARKVRGLRDLQSMAQLEMLHPDGKEMVGDEEIWIGIELFAEYVEADDKRKELVRAEAKAREDAQQASSFEDAETVVEAKNKPDLAAARRTTKFFEHFEAPIFVRLAREKTTKKEAGPNQELVDGVVYDVVKVWQYECKLCQKSYTQQGSGNGGLSKHLRESQREDHRQAYAEAAGQSRHTKFQARGEDETKLTEVRIGMFFFAKLSSTHRI